MIKLSFEDRLKEEKEDYCRFHCPVKGRSRDQETGVDVECDECGCMIDVDVWIEGKDTCDSCQLDEFINNIRDFDKSIIKEERQLAYKAGYDHGRFEEKVGCSEE